MRRFVGLRLSEAIPDASTILHFRHLLERHHLGQGLLRSSARPGRAGGAAEGGDHRGRHDYSRAAVHQEPGRAAAPGAAHRGGGSLSRRLATVNNYSRESLAIKVAASIRREGVVEVLRRLMQQHRLPRTIRVDNDHEFTFKRLEQWAKGNCRWNSSARSLNQVSGPWIGGEPVES